MIKYNLESDTLRKYLPVLTTTNKLQPATTVSFLCQVKYLCILQQINVNLSICIKDIKNNAACLSVFLGRPASFTQKQTTPSHTFLHSHSFRPISLYSFSEQSYRAGRLSISEINTSQSYTSLKAITEANSLALHGVGFTKRIKKRHHTCARNHLFLCALFVQAVVKRQSCHLRNGTCCDFLIATISRPCTHFHTQPCVSFGQHDSRSD